MSTILRSQILSEIDVCPFCMEEVELDPHPGCCKEVKHARAYLTETETYLVDETEVVEDTKAGP